MEPNSYPATERVKSRRLIWVELIAALVLGVAAPAGLGVANAYGLLDAFSGPDIVGALVAVYAVFFAFYATAASPAWLEKLEAAMTQQYQRSSWVFALRMALVGPAVFSLLLLIWGSVQGNQELMQMAAAMFAACIPLVVLLWWMRTAKVVAVLVLATVLGFWSFRFLQALSHWVA